VVDTPSRRYWHDTTAGDSDAALAAFLASVLSGTATTQRQGLLAYPQVLVNAIGLYPTAALGAAIVTLVAWALWRLVFAGLCGYGASTTAVVGVDSGKGGSSDAKPTGTGTSSKAARKRAAPAAAAPGGSGSGAGDKTLHLRPSFRVQAAEAAGRARGGSDSSDVSVPTEDFLTGGHRDDLDVGEDGEQFTLVDDGSGGGKRGAGSSSDEDSEAAREKARRQRAPATGDAVRKRSRIRLDD